jgi:hypothetical protein
MSSYKKKLGSLLGEDQKLLPLAEEAQEAERDFLEHEAKGAASPYEDIEDGGASSPEKGAGHEFKTSQEQITAAADQSYNEEVLEEKGYDLQQAYRKIGGMGKQAAFRAD